MSNLLILLVFRQHRANQAPVTTQARLKEILVSIADVTNEVSFFSTPKDASLAAASKGKVVTFVLSSVLEFIVSTQDLAASSYPTF